MGLCSYQMTVHTKTPPATATTRKTRIPVVCVPRHYYFDRCTRRPIGVGAGPQRGGDEVHVKEVRHPPRRPVDGTSHVCARARPIIIAYREHGAVLRTGFPTITTTVFYRLGAAYITTSLTSPHAIPSRRRLLVICRHNDTRGDWYLGRGRHGRTTVRAQSITLWVRVRRPRCSRCTVGPNSIWPEKKTKNYKYHTYSKILKK